MAIKSLTVALIFLAIVKAGTASAQISREKKAELEMGAAFRRMSATLRYAHRENNGTSNLELTPEQMVGLAEIRTKYSDAVNGYAKLIDSEANAIEAIRFLNLESAKLQDKLFGDVYLKHQVDQVQHAVFESFLKQNEGNIVGTIASSYIDEADLNMNQTNEFYELDKTVKDQIRKAKEEYERKVKEIVKKSETQLDEILTAKQSQKLGSFRAKSKN